MTWILQLHYIYSLRMIKNKVLQSRIFSLNDSYCMWSGWNSHFSRQPITIAINVIDANWDVQYCYCVELERYWKLNNPLWCHSINKLMNWLLTNDGQLLSISSIGLGHKHFFEHFFFLIIIYRYTHLCNLVNNPLSNCINESMWRILFTSIK